MEPKEQTDSSLIEKARTTAKRMIAEHGQKMALALSQNYLDDCNELNVKDTYWKELRDRCKSKTLCQEVNDLKQDKP